MLLQNDLIRHTNSIAHQGKLVVVATCTDGTLLYTVRKEGFEQSAVAPGSQPTGWEIWNPVPLPDDAAGDASVTNLEKKKYTVPSESVGTTEQVLQSLYQSATISAIAPVQLVSTEDYLYIFRQSMTGTLLMDRFVLDGMANKLIPKIEVRYKRSRQKNSSASPSDSRGQVMDTLDFTDVNGKYFFEPTVEISCVHNLRNGAFSVVRVPTNEHGKFYWHFFSCQSGDIEVVTLRASEDGLVAVQDHTIFEADPAGGPGLVARSIPGILRRTVHIPTGTAVGVAATIYDIQKEVINTQTKESHLLRVESRVMVAVSTDTGVTALSFGIAPDGTLSKIKNDLDSSKLLRADQDPLLLPLSTLDDITPFGAVTPPAQGTITGMTLGTDADDTGQVIVTSPEATTLTSGDIIQFHGTVKYDGLYTVTGVSGSTFQIQAPNIETVGSTAVVGTWNKLEKKQSLIFDGMVTSYETSADGKLMISAVNHGLADGDQVQIIGSATYDGAYPISIRDDTHFVISTPWEQPAALSGKILSMKRRGIVLHVSSTPTAIDNIKLPPASCPEGTPLTVSFWAKGSAMFLALDDSAPAPVMVFLASVYASPGGIFTATCNHFGEKQGQQVMAEVTANIAGWNHWAFVKESDAGPTQIYCNGVVLTPKATGANPPRQPNTKVTSVRLSGNDIEKPGTCADLRIYSRALGAEEIKNGMYLPLSGREQDLEGYWRLGAIIEGSPRMVVDLSLHARHGTVTAQGGGAGGAYVSARELSRTLGDGTTLVVRYTNDELIGVIEGGTYQEELEVRLDGALDPTLAIDPRNVDGNGGKAFELTYWGKKNRTTDERIVIPSDPSLPTNFEDLQNQGWYRVTREMLIPPDKGISYVRTFELSDVKGSWKTLEVRRHKLSLVSDAITLAKVTEQVSAPAPLPAGSPQDKLIQLQRSLRDGLSWEQQEGAILQVLADLGRQRNLPGANTATIDAKIAAQKAKLVTVQAQVKSLDTTLAGEVATVNDLAAAPPTWPMPVIHTDERALVTQATHLDFVRPGSAITAAQTCDGHVLVSYVDDEGRMQEVVFNGTLESKNAAFEQWMVQRPGGSLSLAADTSVVALSPPLALGSRWTVEAWFYYPLPQKTWNTLSTSADGKNGQIVVRNGQYLGTRIGGRFLGTGHSLAQLCPGWHHVAAVKQGTGASASLRFYVNGKPVGDTLFASGSILALNGRSDIVNLPAVSFIGGNAMTYCISTLDKPGVASGDLLRMKDANKNDLLFIKFQTTNGVSEVVFTCGADSVTLPFTKSSPDEWTHWAFVKNVAAGTMSIYRNGALGVTVTGKMAPLPAAAPQPGAPVAATPSVASITIGQLYNGSIVEPSLWSRDLSSDDIALLMGRVVSGDESGLTGAWSFLGAAAPLVVKDRLAVKPNDGTTGGVPQATPVSFDGAAEIGAIGNILAGAPTTTTSATPIPVAPPPNVIVLNGTNAAVQIPAACFPGGKEISVAFWAKGGPPKQCSTLSMVGAQNERVFNVHVPWDDGVAFDAGNVELGFDRVLAPMGSTPFQGIWTHWAFTKNATTGEMIIYRDGAVFASGTGKTMQMPAATKIVLGAFVNNQSTSGYYAGSVAEVSIWSKALSAAEVRAYKDQSPTGNEPNLLGYYRFDAAKMVDLTPRKLDGTYVGGAKVEPGVGLPCLTAGNAPPVSTALVLNGTDAAAQIPTACFPGGKEITVGFWSKCGPLGYCMSIHIAGPNGERILAISAPWIDGVVYFDAGDHGSATTYDRLSIASGATPVVGVWTHWAFTKDSATGEMSIYRDGSLLATSKGNGWPLRAAAKIIVGAHSDAGKLNNYYVGSIAELSIWSKALTPAEILALKSKTLTGQEANLLGYYRFEASKMVDLTPRKLDGTYVGGAKAALAIGLPVATPAATVTTITAAGNAQQFGKIAEVRVWRDALSDDEVEVDSLIYLTGAEPGLHAYYPLSAPVAANVPNLVAQDAATSILAAAIDASFSAGRPPVGNPGNLAMLFDGLDDCISLPAVDVDFSTGMTIEAWVLFDDISKSVKIIDLGNGPSADNIVMGNVAGSRSLLVQVYRGATAQSLQANDVIDVGRWMHLAITIDAANAANIYKNGQLVKTGTVQLPAKVKRTSCTMGKSSFASDALFYGQLADLRLWSSARTQAQIQAHNHRRVSAKDPSLQGYWPLVHPKPERTSGNITVVGPQATPMSTTWSVSAPLPLGENAGGAIAFDGASSYLAVGEMEPDFEHGFTLEGWIFVDGAKDATFIDFNDGTDLNRILLRFWPGSKTMAFDVHRPEQKPLYTPKLPAWSALDYYAKSITSETQYEARRWLPENCRVTGYTNVQGWAASITGAFERGAWMHIAVTISASGAVKLYKNGKVITTQSGSLPDKASFKKNCIGKQGAGGYFFSGKVTELRLWNTARAPEEILANMNARIAGNEENLFGYWPLFNTSSSSTPDLSANKLVGRVAGGAYASETNALPMGFDAVRTADYSTIGLDPDDDTRTKKLAVMRRLYSGSGGGGAFMLSDRRIEAAQLVWVGNGQFAPTLLGFIEGAPPVPSENLTESSDYNGATSVQLTVSNDVDYSWSRTQASAIGASVDAFMGVETSTMAGIGVVQQVFQASVGVKATANLSKEQTASSTVSSHSSGVMTEQLELRGMHEDEPKFPHLGRRFIPKNVGYALVISSLADIFITKLAKSGKMVGYMILPVDGIPPDVNTISFLMNPAYVMQGSLDGMTGSRPTSDRFHRNVPEMRSQYGALYPASYYRLKEAYALKEKLDGQDKAREAFFAHFSLSDLSDLGKKGGDSGGGTGPADWIKKITGAQKDASKQAQAQNAFKSWQTRMEALLARSGKRNIVNTYVWDANGGLHMDQQSFAGTVEHTIGGSFSFDGSIGLQADISVVGVALNLTALANFNMTQTMSKSQSTSTGVQLTVGLPGVEYAGITDYNEKPINPGEKVNRYRFMTFYLEGSTDHFNDFFREVVDPEWLMGNSEEARALRQAKGKANKTWRVLHRVTYVERPALAAIGLADVRVGVQREAAPADMLTRYLESLTKNQLGLQSQLDAIKELLASMQPTQP